MIRHSHTCIRYFISACINPVKRVTFLSEFRCKIHCNGSTCVIMIGIYQLIVFVVITQRGDAFININGPFPVVLLCIKIPCGSGACIFACFFIVKVALDTVSSSLYVDIDYVVSGNSVDKIRGNIGKSDLIKQGRTLCRSKGRVVAIKIVIICIHISSHFAIHQRPSAVSLKAKQRMMHHRFNCFISISVFGYYVSLIDFGNFDQHIDIGRVFADIVYCRVFFNHLTGDNVFKRTGRICCVPLRLCKSNFYITNSKFVGSTVFCREESQRPCDRESNCKH